MISLHTSSLKHYGLNRIFEFAAAADYDGIEIEVNKDNFDTQNAEYIKKLSEKNKLPIVALCAPKEADEKILKHIIEMASYLNCPIVSISAPKLMDFKQLKWIKKEVPTIKKKKNIEISLINNGSKTVFGFLPERSMNNSADLKQFGSVTIDCSMVSSKKEDLIRFYENLKKTVTHIHLSNVKKHKEYSFPNEGILPLESFLKKLKHNNYQGAISLKVRPSELSAGEDEVVIKLLQKAKNFIEEYFSD